MSRLKNAPLVEVVFEVLWLIEESEDLNNFQYMHGDLYSKIQNKYPFREQVNNTNLPIPLDILKNKPVYRFRTAAQKYPLTQIGPGIITVNTIGKIYDWDNFVEEIKYILKNLEKIDTFKAEKVVTRLTYFDFIEFNFSEGNIFKFLKKNMNLEINQNIIGVNKKPNSFNNSFSYKEGDDQIDFNLKKRYLKDTEGVWMETFLTGKERKFDVNEIIKWSDLAHRTCKDIFNRTFQGKLIKKFKGES